MNNENNFNFHISGLPENEEFEIQEPTKKMKIGISGNGKMRMPSVEDLRKISQEDIEDIKKQLPPEMTKFMSAIGVSPENMINQALSMMEGLDDEQLQGMMNAMVQSTDDGCDDCDTCPSCGGKTSTDADDMFPTGNPKYLFPEEFGSIPCLTRENLYDEFVDVYGTDSTKYLDDNVGIRNFILNDITSQLNFDKIKNMRFINTCNNFILFYMEPEDPTEYGYYCAVIKRPDNSFACYIPTYCNTFDLIEKEDNVEVIQFNEDDQPYAFSDSADNITSFVFLAANLIEFAISFALAPVKHVLLSPNEFGTIKPTRASINADSSFFPIGKITSNKSTSATLLLKDAELPLDSENYNIFMKFPKVVDEHMLRFLSGTMFNVDFNNCELLKNVELKYTQDGKLYFDIEHLGDF